MSTTPPTVAGLAPRPPGASRAAGDAGAPAAARRGLGGNAYSPPRFSGPIDLRLDANESRRPAVDLASLCAALNADQFARYPATAPLEAELREALAAPGVDVVVTAGGDDAIDRVCRAYLEPGRELVLPSPTFEMIERSALAAGASVRPVPWRTGPYPLRAVLDEVTGRTAMIAVVSPNNPTGAVVSARDLRALSARVPGAVLLVDMAYAEYADEDLTPVVLELPNAVMIRTFSKAFGLAGLRIGYAAGRGDLIRPVRRAASPYPVSAVSLAAARQSLRHAAAWLPVIADRARAERARLHAALATLGADPRESQGNFVLAEFHDADWAWRGLAALGIGVRRFDRDPSLARSLRISCPGSEADFSRLLAGLRAVLRPDVLLIPDASPFAGDTQASCIERLSRRLPAGVFCPPPPSDPGTSPENLASLARALGSLNGTSAWMICRSPEEVGLARAAGAVPIGLASTHKPLGPCAERLVAAGAAMTSSLEDLERQLP